MDTAEAGNGLGLVREVGEAGECSLEVHAYWSAWEYWSAPPYWLAAAEEVFAWVEPAFG